MGAPVLVAIGVLAAGAGAGAFALLRKRIAAGGPLSERRKFVLASIASVVPSQYGDAKFARIAPGYDPDDAALPKGFTTCGYLPCYVGRELGVPNCITQGGLEQMRTNGRKSGAWVDATGKNHPKPGDLFAIGSDRLITHVGVFIESRGGTNGPTWRTADAGQGAVGAGQRADYIDRPYDAATKTLGGPGAVFVPSRGWSIRDNPRTVAGWIDIDKVTGARP